MVSRSLLRIGLRSFAIVLLGSMMLVLAAVPAFGATTWSLSADYLARGNSAAPVIEDELGNAVWYLKTASSATDPGTYVPFRTWATNYDSWMVAGAPPIKGWYSGTDPFDVPHTSVNGSGSDISCVGGAFSWLNGTVLTHPGLSPITFSVTEWRSPVTGVASISAALKDMHIQSGGNGYEWWILQGSTVLSHAVVSVEGGTASSSHSAVPIVAGDSLYLVVGPNGNYGGDTTQIEFAVTVADTDPPVVSTPASSSWSLALLLGLGFAAAAETRRRRATTSV